MCSDETQTVTLSLGTALDARLGKGTEPSLDAETVARWTRAVTTPHVLRQPPPQLVPAPRPFGDRSVFPEEVADTGTEAMQVKADSNPEPHAVLQRQPALPASAVFAKAPVNPTSAFSVADADAARTLPLSALRGLHASHRQGRLDAVLLDNTDGSRPVPQQATSASTADLLMPQFQALQIAESQVTADGVSPASGSEKLHALIESCCSRLWLSDTTGRAPQGVMLDLGRWMPGCTVEVAKAAGVLRITLRGVDGGDRSRLEEELQALGEGLAHKLGCQVVASVATNKELT